MTGEFVKAARASECISLNCRTVIQPGEMVYLFKKLERQTVCLDCAKSRWGYSPEDQPMPSSPAPERQRLGFDSTGTILRKLQHANRNDPRMRQAGGDR
jgi:hypothetical protein